MRIITVDLLKCVEFTCIRDIISGNSQHLAPKKDLKVRIIVYRSSVVKRNVSRQCDIFPPRFKIRTSKYHAKAVAGTTPLESLVSVRFNPDI